ncbi:MAG: cardiolipin synthase [Verrucomicrobiaceae bacterium]
MLVMHVSGLILSLGAIAETRTPQGTVAWILSLNFVPVVAVPAYLIFGEDEMEDYLRTRSKGVEALRPLAEKLLEDVEAVSPSDYEENDLLGTLGRISSLPVTTNNRPELLTDGENTYRSIFEAIDSAKKYILVQFYIIRSDGIGGELKDRLMSKAKEGVRVYVIFDDYGSIDLGEEFLTDLRSSGAEVTPFMNIEGDLNRFQLNYRNHRKLVVVDGITAFVGGHNVGDEYLGKHPTLTPWRDCHMRISGPVVPCLQIPFLEDWKWATGETIHDLDWNLERADKKTRGDSQAVCIASGPVDQVETCSLFFHAAIHAAKKRIWIATPYFVPDEALVTSLQLAAKRGVDVRILIPSKNDSLLVERSALSYLEDLDLPGIEIYSYTRGFMHQKVVIVDDDFTAIGSANFDNRSLRLNFELMVGVSDEVFQEKVVKMLQEDFENSVILDKGLLEEKSVWFRFTVRFARLLAPIQ